MSVAGMSGAAIVDQRSSQAPWRELASSDAATVTVAGARLQRRGHCDRDHAAGFAPDEPAGTSNGSAGGDAGVVALTGTVGSPCVGTW